MADASTTADPFAPYRVEQIDADDGPRWRLAGPGLRDARAYPYGEFRDKLAELARVMNFAWHQCRLEAARSAAGDGSGRSADDPGRRARATIASAAAAKAHVVDPTARDCSPHTPCDPDVAQAPTPTDRA